VYDAADGYYMNVRHTLLVPAHYNIDVRTAGGGISGADIGGQIKAKTAGGSIRALKGASESSEALR
jgi:hypothetical protein